MKTKFLETIKVLDGKVYNIGFHQKRYERVLTSLGIESYKNLSRSIKPPPSGLYRCRLIYDCKKIIDVSYYVYKKRNVQSLKILTSDSLNYGLKYENRDEINQLFEQRGTCDDILIVKNGFVTDTSIANIAFFDGEKWLTPSKPLLEGTTRERLLNSSKIIEADIRLEEIYKYTKVALLNAMIDFDILANIRYEY